MERIGIDRRIGEEKGKNSRNIGRDNERKIGDKIDSERKMKEKKSLGRKFRIGIGCNDRIGGLGKEILSRDLRNIEKKVREFERIERIEDKEGRREEYIGSGEENGFWRRLRSRLSRIEEFKEGKGIGIERIE